MSIDHQLEEQLKASSLRPSANKPPSFRRSTLQHLRASLKNPSKPSLPPIKPSFAIPSDSQTTETATTAPSHDSSATALSSTVVDEKIQELEREIKKFQSLSAKLDRDRKQHELEVKRFHGQKVGTIVNRTFIVLFLASKFFRVKKQFR